MIDTSEEKQIDDTIMVSICCLTYNHENYVRECLDGFLMQKTNFPFEVLVHDDASSDDTASIIREYAERYPTIIKPILQTENQLSKGVGVTRVFNFPRAKGKYITMCEGDDYYVDPMKLQNHVDFLEEHTDYGLVSTDFNVYYETSDEMIIAMNNSNDIDYSDILDDFSQLLKKNHVSTCTVMFRKELLSQLNLDEISKYAHGDLVLWLEMSQKTKFKYFNTPTSVYRVRGESMSNSQSKLKRLDFLIGSKKIKMDYSAKYGTKSQKQKAKYEYYHRVLIKATYDKDLKLATHAFQNLPFRVKKDYMFYVFTRSKLLNTTFLKFRKQSQSS